LALSARAACVSKGHPNLRHAIAVAVVFEVAVVVASAFDVGPRVWSHVAIDGDSGQKQIQRQRQLSLRGNCKDNGNFKNHRVLDARNGLCKAQ
jgi:hypothetical protein